MRAVPDSAGPCDAGAPAAGRGRLYTFANMSPIHVERHCGDAIEPEAARRSIRQGARPHGARGEQRCGLHGPDNQSPAMRRRNLWRRLAVLGLACAIGLGCTEKRRVEAQESAKQQWQLHPQNPIVKAGDLRDRAIWNDPSVLRLDDGTYVMYMTTSVNEPFKPPILPFRALSPDGIRWSLDPAAPLLTPAGTPYIDLETPSVVRYRGKWHMYFMGVLPPGSVPASHIGHALSDDGIHWALDPQGIKVIAATGKVEDWNGFLVSEPGAVVFNDRIYLYFGALGARPGAKPPQIMTIGLATSTDGTHFDTPRRVLAQDDALFPPGKGFAGYATVSAVVDQGRMHLFYNVIANPKMSGSDIEQVALHHAVSGDGETGWRQDKRPILTRADLDWTDDGLEFKHVYIVGMEDTLFPSPMSSGSAKELEEERRLFYVAVTRAEKQATFSYALNRYKWGNLERCSPSRFLREIDQKYLNYPQTGGKPFGQSTSIPKNTSTLKEAPKQYINEDKLKKITKIAITPGPSFNGTDPSLFTIGDSVEHERFGKGKILSIEGQLPNTTATVEFDKEGSKKLLLRFAKLKRI